MRRIILAISVLFVFACAEQEKYANESIPVDALTEEASETQAGASTSISEQSTPENRKMIWSAKMEFQVKDVTASTDVLSKICKEHGGFISKMNMSSTKYQKSNHLQIRVNNENFSPLVKQLQSESIFTSNLEINSKDVTEEFVDIESRLKTKKDVRDRYIDILRNKTGDVKDVIEAEEAIRKITEEIEAKEGRLRYLTDKVSFSTIDLVIFQKVSFTEEPNVYVKPYYEKVLDALENGWSFVTGFILFMLNMWPLLILLAVLYWKRKWLKMKLSRKAS
ncbi:MAG: hypothetical protein CMO01_06525 [Thalassobius sp.]|nr:hypothetical protein [Thalassovita sp.]